MLNRQVCEQCQKNNGLEKKFRAMIDWEKGITVCPLVIRHLMSGDFSSIIVDTKKPPPQWCPFKFEHRITQEC